MVASNSHWIVLLVVLYIDVSNCTICDGPNSCNSSISCDSGQCICIGQDSCDHIGIYCDSGEDCFVTCNQSRSCQDSNIYCDNSGYGCHINCIGDNSCNRITVYGKNASILTINTSVPTNELGCQLCNTEINCPVNGECNIECKAGKSMCKAANIDATSSNSLHIKCKQRTTNAVYPEMTCGGMNVYCPSNGNANQCIIEGDPVTNPNNIEQLNIWSENGFDGVSVIGANSGSESIGTIHCGDPYNSDCVISDNENNKCNLPAACDATTSSTTTTTTTSTPESINPDIEESTENLGYVFEYILVTIIVLFGIVAIIGSIDARCLRINDFYRVGAIVTSLLQILDMLSDCFLAIDINLRNKQNGQFTVILYICIISIILPSVLSLFQVYYYASKVWIKDNNITKWLLKYSRLLYLTSIFTGSSFTAIELMNSNILGLPFFEMNLNTKQMISFKTQRIYSVILLENIPQLILQSWYIITIENANNIIAISSVIFSAISLIVTVLSITMEKSIINSQEYISITVDITGQSVVSKSKQCKKRVKQIQQEISTIIGLDYNLIEILKPINIPNGLQLEMHVLLDTNNSSNSEQDKYKNLLDEAMTNGNLAQCVCTTWKLSNMPNVSNIKSVKVTTNINGGKKGKLMSQTVETHAMSEMIDSNAVISSNDEQL